MALPTRVSRQGGYEPFDSMQREFDSMLGRFFGQGREGNRPRENELSSGPDHRQAARLVRRRGVDFQLPFAARNVPTVA